MGLHLTLFSDVLETECLFHNIAVGLIGKPPIFNKRGFPYPETLLFEAHIQRHIPYINPSTKYSIFFIWLVLDH